MAPEHASCTTCSWARCHRMAGADIVKMPHEGQTVLPVHLTWIAAWWCQQLTATFAPNNIYFQCAVQYLFRVLAAGTHLTRQT